MKHFYKKQERKPFQNITISDEEMTKMVEEVMKNFDENNDGMIEFNEMKNLLNVEDNVLTELSLTKNLSTQQFNTIFDYYDNDSELRLSVGLGL